VHVTLYTYPDTRITAASFEHPDFNVTVTAWRTPLDALLIESLTISTADRH
jgi:hypothetical protein